MSELRDLIERATKDYRPGDPPLEPTLRRARRGELRRRAGVVVLIGSIVGFLVASAVGAFEPPPQMIGPVAPEAGCGRSVSWYDCSLDWVERIGQAAGFEVAPANGGEGEGSRAIEVSRAGTTLYLWADAHEELSGDFVPIEAEEGRNYRRSGIYLADGSSVWTDDLNYVWDTQGMRVRIQDPEGKVTTRLIADLVRASQSTPVEGAKSSDDTSGSCDYGPWATYCSEAEWLRRAAEHGGFEVTGDTGSALIIETPQGSAYLWGNGLERHDDPRGMAKAVERGEYVAVSQHEWALWRERGSDRYVWEMQGVYVWMEVEQGGLTEETVLAVRQATRETPFRTDCPDRGYADLSARSGRVGDQLQVTGRTFGEAEGGFTAVTTFVEVWWNLDSQRHESAYVDGQDPVAAGPGPVMELVEWQLDHECEWGVGFTIPDVPPGSYEVVLISFSGDRELAWGASGYPLGTVTVGE